MANDNGERLKNITTVLKKYDLIFILYKELIRLEKENKPDKEKKMKGIWDLIRDLGATSDDLLREYPLGDGYNDEFVTLMAEMNHIPHQDCWDISVFKETNKYKRIWEHMLELRYEEHQSNNTTDIPNTQLAVEGTIYEAPIALKIIEEEYPSELEKAKKLVEKQEKEQYKYLCDLDDYYLTIRSLEAHIFIEYIQEAIKKNYNQTEIRNKLIEFKYGLISNIRTLEHTFRIGWDPAIVIPTLYNKLTDIFDRNPELFEEFIQFESAAIEEEEEKLLERNKKTYFNIDDFLSDVLLNLSIRTHLTCIPSKMVRDAVIEDIGAATELAKSSIDKTILSKSRKIKKEYTIDPVDKYVVNS